MSDLKSIKSIVKYFIRQQMRYPRLFFGMLAFHPFAILFLGFLPSLIVSNILNRISSHDFIKGDLWGSFGPAILLAIASEMIGGVVIWRIVIYFNWRLEGLVTRNINRQVFDHLMKQSPAFHSNRFSGSLVSQTSKLTGAYIRFTDTTTFQVIGLFWALVFTSVLLARRAPVYVVSLILFTAIYLTVAVVLTAKIRKINQRESEAENDQTGHLADSIANVMAVKSFAAGQAENDRFGEATERTRQATLNLMRASLGREAIFGSIGTTINAISLILAVGSIVMFNANIATVFLILNYTNNILVRLWEFSTQALRNYNRAFGEAQAMLEVLDIKPAIKDPEHPEQSKISAGKIDFKNVSFSHEGNALLFDQLNLSISAGEKIGLVGHSGSGKTTFTRLLLRFNDLTSGKILIDSQDITHITQDTLRQNIAYVPQEPLLFHRTIRENIAYGKPNASDAEIIEAARKAHSLEFIEKLPKGFGTLVGERGIKLSGGQRQRIVIARAILKAAPILVLDEATSALDSESEGLIQKALWELMNDCTAIVVAHRLSTVQKMDRILVLENGQIVEQGTHAQLVKAKGLYAGLWAHQSGGFIKE